MITDGYDDCIDEGGSMVITKDIGTLRQCPQVSVGKHICHLDISKKTMITHM